MKDDTISRAAAIDALRTCYDTKTISMDNGDEYINYDDAVGEIEQLPSTQLERKTGKWIYSEDEYGIDGYHCDECGFFVPWDYVHKFINYIEDYNFCPHCGADMRGDKDAVD